MWKKKKTWTSQPHSPLKDDELKCSGRTHMPSWKLSMSGNRVRGKGDSVKGFMQETGVTELGTTMVNLQGSKWTRKGKGEEGIKAGGKEEAKRLVKRQEPGRRQSASPGRHLRWDERDRNTLLWTLLSKALILNKSSLITWQRCHIFCTLSMFHRVRGHFHLTEEETVA